MSEFSTFGIGGPIRFFCIVRNVEEVEEAIGFANAHHLPWLVLGKGSNCLFHDEGFYGVVLLNCIDQVIWNGSRVIAGAGASFSLLGIQSARRGLGGLEFASGIPASVGGAVFMNAGANGQQTKDVLDSVLFLDCHGVKREFFINDLQMGYRSSSFQTLGGVILSAAFQLHACSTSRLRQREMIERRMKTQPLKEKSVGCIFRNPESGLSAGALIDRFGLKGFSIGGAMVSEIHANFIVNRGGATAADVRCLISIIQSKVYEMMQIHLQPEIRMIGPYGESISG